MNDSITVAGIVATSPRHLVTSSGLAITTFRLASGQRRYDRTKQSWVDGETNWYTVSSFRQLAHNVEGSVRKGEHVLVSGRLRIRAWENADRSGTSIEVEAEAVGHDLSWCTTSYRRTVPAEEADPEAAGSTEAAGSADAGLQSGLSQSWRPVSPVIAAAFMGPQTAPRADPADATADGFLPAGTASG